MSLEILESLCAKGGDGRKGGDARPSSLSMGDDTCTVGVYGSKGSAYDWNVVAEGEVNRGEKALEILRNIGSVKWAQRGVFLVRVCYDLQHKRVMVQ